jgi:hypothetical protein
MLCRGRYVFTVIYSFKDRGIRNYSLQLARSARVCAADESTCRRRRYAFYDSAQPKAADKSAASLSR